MEDTYTLIRLSKFCAFHRISHVTYYAMKRHGFRPQEIRVGTHIFILVKARFPHKGGQ